METGSGNTRPEGKVRSGWSAWVHASTLPVFSWLPGYDRRLIKWDLLAGITLATFVLPESMAYATLAGLPPQAGIYCCLAGSLLFAVFTSSKQLAVGPTSAISLMIGTTVITLAGTDPAHRMAVASFTALIVACIAMLFYLLKLSVIVNFISESVLLGFKAGAALAIISTQLPKLFGIHAPGVNFIERMDAMVRQLGDTQTGVLLFGITALVLLTAGSRILPGKPLALVLVILSIVLLRFSRLNTLGLQQVGTLPSGLPSLVWPAVHPDELQQIFGLALACFLMGYIETISAGRVIAEKHGYEIQPGRELLALASANAASAVTGGYVASGGLSQSTVNDRSGARSPLALIIQAVCLVLILMFLTGYMREMPEVILAVIVIHAVSGLIRVKELRSLWYLSHTEFGIAMAAIAGVLVLGILEGVLLASLISILLIIKRAAAPPVAVLGMIPGTGMFSDLARHPDNCRIPGVLILRIEASVFYFNERFIREEIERQLTGCDPAVRWLVLDLSASPYIDASGAKMLKKLADDLPARGFGLRVAEALSEARDMLRKAGIEAVTGHISRKVSLFEVVETLQNSDLDAIQEKPYDFQHNNPC